MIWSKLQCVIHDSTTIAMTNLVSLANKPISSPKNITSSWLLFVDPLPHRKKITQAIY